MELAKFLASEALPQLLEALKEKKPPLTDLVLGFVLLESPTRWGAGDVGTPTGVTGLSGGTQ